MTVPTSPRRGGLVIGLALVALGGRALLVQVSGLGPRLAGLDPRRPGSRSSSAASSSVGRPAAGWPPSAGSSRWSGVVLAVQEAYDLYQTWAYAWALVAPGGVGLGLAIYGLVTGRRDDLRGGLGALVVGIVIFLVGFLFFEGVLDLSDGASAT